MTKTRPMVDQTSFDLAAHWLSDYAVVAESADAASDTLEDATWDLADAIQQAIEEWIEDAKEVERIKETRR